MKNHYIKKGGDKMYIITLTAENHGYTIRLETQNYRVEDNKSIEFAETISTLGIIDNRETAIKVFNALNTLINVLTKNNILKGDVFRHIT